MVNSGFYCSHLLIIKMNFRLLKHILAVVCSIPIASISMLNAKNIL